MARRRLLRSDHPPSRFPPGFPLRGEIRAILRSLLDYPACTQQELLDDIDKYITRVRDESTRREFVDVQLAERLGTTARGLVSLLGPNTSEEHAKLIRAAVRYFFLETDAESDLNSVVGFDDDADVLNAVARFLGRNDLVVEVE